MDTSPHVDKLTVQLLFSNWLISIYLFLCLCFKYAIFTKYMYVSEIITCYTTINCNPKCEGEHIFRVH